MKSQKRILIVDDDADVLLFLRDRLNALGFEVLTAANGKEGVEALQHHTVNGVLLDLCMPVMGGLLMLEQLAESSTFPPVIVMSPSEHRPEMQLAIIKGAMDYLIKPIAPDVLTDKCLRLFY